MIPLWPKDRLITHILFELCLFWYLAQSTYFRDTLYQCRFDDTYVLSGICIFICQAKNLEIQMRNPKPNHSWYACSSRSSFFAKCTKKVREKWLETLIMNCIKRSRIFSTHNHGLRTPNEAFFHWNSKLLGLGRQIGQIIFGAFSAKL